MALFLENLTKEVRLFMLEEIELDIRLGRLYFSKRFSVRGKEDYPKLIKQAAQQFDDEWLSDELRKNYRINITEPRGFTSVAVPSNAAEIFAEGEFNRFYIRGLCRLAIKNNIDEVEVYRAKSVETPRLESSQLIGNLIDVKSLLEDLRENPGIDPRLRVPSGPNSELSVRLPESIITEAESFNIVFRFGHKIRDWFVQQLTNLFNLIKKIKIFK